MTEPREPISEQPKRYGRGLFLVTVAGGISSLAWGNAVWGHVSKAIGPAEALVPLVPSGGWRIYTVADSMPTFDPASWRLSVGGLVEKPLSLTYDELRSLPRANQASTFHCVTGWTISKVRWGGVRIADLLAHAGPLPKGGGLQFVSAERPYVDYLTRGQAALHDVMLAYEMDGKPLPRVHGAPLRLVIPEMYGYKNVKWVSEMNVVPGVKDGYWEQLGYDRDAWIGHSNGYSSAPAPSSPSGA